MLGCVRLHFQTIPPKGSWNIDFRSIRHETVPEIGSRKLVNLSMLFVLLCGAKKQTVHTVNETGVSVFEDALLRWV